MNTPTNYSSSLQRMLARGALGLLGGVLGGLTMNLFARAVRAMGDGREAQGAAPGHDRNDRGVQPPQAEEVSQDDATVRAGTLAFRLVTGHRPQRRAQRRLGVAAHLAFGGTVGLAYAVISARVPTIRAGYGMAYGGFVWAAADEVVVPAIGLSRGAREQRPGVHAYALLGHFVYAGTLEAVLRRGVGPR